MSHDEQCPCMYRQVAVAGELYLPPRSGHDAVSHITPGPTGLSYTGVDVAAACPSTVIVSDPLLDILPIEIATPLLLLGDESGDCPAIALTDADVQEVETLEAPDSPAVGGAAMSDAPIPRS